MHRLGSRSRRGPLYAGLAVLATVVLVDLCLMFQLTDGKLVYTIDDAYIHLALAENIARGHYGINAGEASAPVSSILWPFLLAVSPSSEALPLVINLLSALISTYLFWRILVRTVEWGNLRAGTLVCFSLLTSLLAATNVVGLIFLGMEHSLQLAAVVAIAWGLLREAETGEAKLWLWIVIALAGAVRYENLAITLVGLLYLLARRHIWEVVLTAVAAAVIVGGFSIFLLFSGLEALPSSVLMKASIVHDGALTVFKNLQATAGNTRGVLLCALGFGLLTFALFTTRDPAQKLLAGAGFGAVALHALAGRYGSYNRYEIYVWAFALLIALSLGGASIERLLASRKDGRSAAGLIAISGASVVLLAFPYVNGLRQVPAAATNIYEQHYQMHRFAVEFYRKPVAVNDLGYVSYKNREYVLDLWGLGSLEAMRERGRGGSAEWMSRLARRHGVELAMVYEPWFPNHPRNWIKIGELLLGHTQITPAHGAVAFYGLNDEACEAIREAIEKFKSTLPPGVRFVYTGGQHRPAHSP